MYRTLALLTSVFLVACGTAPETEQSLSSAKASAPPLDATLLAVHKQLANGLSLGDCSVQSSRSWNGENHSLQVEIESDGEEVGLNFRTSKHITSKVKKKNFLFSERLKSIRLEKVDIRAVPKASRSKRW